MKVVTLRRWLLPASGISLALAGVVYLVALELSDLPLGGGPAPRGNPTLSYLDVEGQPAAEARAGEAGPRAEGVRLLAPQPRRAALGPRRGQGAPAGSELGRGDLLTQLRQGADLADRLLILDEHLRGVSLEQALDDLERLVEAGLPGKFAEAEQLRLAVISRLGRLDDPRVERALVDRIQPRIPRPQRLLALELLAPRYAARGAIHAVAEHDMDPVVREKARWALRKTR